MSRAHLHCPVHSQNCEKRLIASSCLSVCPHGTKDLYLTTRQYSQETRQPCSRNPSKRAAVDLRFRPCGHRDLLAHIHTQGKWTYATAPMKPSNSALSTKYCKRPYVKARYIQRPLLQRNRHLSANDHHKIWSNSQLKSKIFCLTRVSLLHDSQTIIDWSWSGGSLLLAAIMSETLKLPLSNS